MQVTNSRKFYADFSSLIARRAIRSYLAKPLTFPQGFNSGLMLSLLFWIKGTLEIGTVGQSSRDSKYYGAKLLPPKPETDLPYTGLPSIKP